jgi:hypothetical protein
LALWAGFVQTVNAEWARVATRPIAERAAVYEAFRPQWEYGHVAAFVAWLLGYCGLLGFVLWQRRPA